MTNPVKFLATAAAIGALAAPALAQYYPPSSTYPYGQTYPYQQPYPQQGYPQQTYPYGYGYNQGYGYNPGTTGNPVTDIIDSLLGNRYSVTDRQAVRQCANAARAQAGQQYGGGYGNAYGGYGNGYTQGYGSNLHVTSITNVERRSDGLRVSGTLGAGYANQYGNHYGSQYGNQYGYPNSGYVGPTLSFRCNVAYNGVVNYVRVRPAGGY